MKIVPILFIFTLGVLPLQAQWGQDVSNQGGTQVKASVFLHQDGSRSEIYTDYDNRTAEEKVYSGKKLLRRMTYNLDPQGQYADGSLFDAKDRLVYRFSYLRDSQGRVEEEHQFLPNGDLMRKLIYRYNNQGMIASIKAFDKDGKPLPMANDAVSNARPPQPSVQTQKKKR